jgi:hypothetical protein
MRFWPSACILAVLQLAFCLGACDYKDGEPDGSTGMPCESGEDCPGWDPYNKCCGCGIMCWEGTCQEGCIDFECCFRGDCNENCAYPCGTNSECDWMQRCENHECVRCSSVSGDSNCHEYLAEVSCATYGGLWGCPSTGPCKCNCSTGDEGCICRRNEDCYSHCVSEPVDGGCQGIGWRSECYGHVFLEAGCYCTPGEGGDYELLCVE